MKMKSKKVSELTPDDIGRGVSVVVPGYKKPIRTVLMRYTVNFCYVTLHVADRFYPTYLGISVGVDRNRDDTINFCELDRDKWGYMQDLLRLRYVRPNKSLRKKENNE